MRFGRHKGRLELSSKPASVIVPTLGGWGLETAQHIATVKLAIRLSLPAPHPQHLAEHIKDVIVSLPFQVLNDPRLLEQIDGGECAEDDRIRRELRNSLSDKARTQAMVEGKSTSYGSLTWTSKCFPNRDELLLRTVFALPSASMT